MTWKMGVGWEGGLDEWRTGPVWCLVDLEASQGGDVWMGDNKSAVIGTSIVDDCSRRHRAGCLLDESGNTQGPWVVREH